MYIDAVESQIVNILSSNEKSHDCVNTNTSVVFCNSSTNLITTDELHCEGTKEVAKKNNI